MKILVGILWAVLAFPVLAQGGQVKLTTEDAPSLRILSAPIKLDSKKRRVTLSLEVENTGGKTIKAFVWRYQTQGVLQGYKVSITSDMPEVTVVLAPHERKKVLLVKETQVRESIWNMPVRKICNCRHYVRRWLVMETKQRELTPIDSTTETNGWTRAASLPATPI